MSTVKITVELDTNPSVDPYALADALEAAIDYVRESDDQSMLTTEVSNYWVHPAQREL